MERQLVINGFYRHFKDKLYQVKGIAIHSETKEKMVIYQGLYGEYEMYVRPYDMFISEVDHVKYPDVEQKYRFELIDIKTGEALEDISADNEEGFARASSSVTGENNTDIVSEAATGKLTDVVPEAATGKVTDVVPEAATGKETDTVSETATGKETDVVSEADISKQESMDKQEDSKLIRFLDAYDYKEKLDILTSMRGELNDGLIDIMAESIEVAVPEGDMTERYNSLRKCLLAHTKYEGLRLRQ